MTNLENATESLRPGALTDFVGQANIVDHLRIVLGAAAARGEVPGHLLFAGPPGLGKTTLAMIIASELGLPQVTTSGPAIENPADLIGLLSCPEPTVVFIDEIHRLPIQAEEVLYPAMEDGVLDVIVGKGATARTVRLPLEPFVVVGATTQLGSLSSPLRERFRYVGRVRPYDVKELTSVVARSARLLGVDIDGAAAHEIASRSRGTPRVANSLLSLARDWMHVHAPGRSMGETEARSALEAFGIDAAGLDDMARDVLRSVCTTFGGGPVGVRTLAASVGEAEATVADVYEPHLMKTGLLVRTPQGRMATSKAYKHLGLRVPSKLAKTGLGLTFSDGETSGAE